MRRAVGRMQHAPKPSTLDAEDAIVNFSDAALYVAGIQTVFAICTCACDGSEVHVWISCATTSVTR